MLSYNGSHHDDDGDGYGDWLAMNHVAIDSSNYPIERRSWAASASIDRHFRKAPQYITSVTDEPEREKRGNIGRFRQNEESQISGKVWLIILQIEHEVDVINIRRLMGLIGR